MLSESNFTVCQCTAIATPPFFADGVAHHHSNLAVGNFFGPAETPKRRPHTTNPNILLIMGDKSPKSKQKNQAQKNTKASAADKKKKRAIDSKRKQG